jgi:hypothetical protein
MRVRLDADLDTVEERFACRECGARSPWVWSTSTPMDEEESQDFDDLLDFA